jgi:hypothetical protein
MSNKWMSGLNKVDYAVKRDYNPYSNVIRSSSPSMNYIYGNSHGLPRGYSEVLWGAPKAGKTIITNDKIGRLHQDDPEALVLKFNTEQREELQLTTRSMKQWGIDPDRYIAYNTNRPDEIFDFIATTVAAQCQKGAPIAYIILDSTSDIVGRRTLNADSVMTQQIGDEAKTLQDGLKIIKPIIRRYKIAMTLVAQARAEMDPLEQMRGNKLKMHAAYALQHFAEYFIFTEQNRGATGKTDLSGNSFIDDSKKGTFAQNERLAHKIKVTMKSSSAGPAGRTGEFTLDYYNGIVNQYEEVFLLGVGQGVVKRPNNVTYVMPDFPVTGQEQKYRGKDDFITAIRENKPLSDEILKRVRMLDIEAMEQGRQPYSGIVESDEEAAASKLTGYDDEPSGLLRVMENSSDQTA